MNFEVSVTSCNLFDPVFHHPVVRFADAKKLSVPTCKYVYVVFVVIIGALVRLLGCGIAAWYACVIRFPASSRDFCIALGVGGFHPYHDVQI